MSKSKILTFEEEQELFRRYSDEGDIEARDEIIEHNTGLVKSVAHMYKVAGVEQDDLISEGTIGLMTAIEKFDYKKGFKFSTYAIHWVKQAISRYIAYNSRSIRLPVHVNEKVFKINKFTQDFLNENGCEPTMKEIAEALGMSETVVKNCITASVPVCSLNLQAGDDGEEIISLIPNTDPSPEELTEISDMNSRLYDAIDKCLTDKEKFVIEKRFGIGDGKRYTLEEIGDMIVLSRERVRQIEHLALKKLRRGLNNSKAA